MRVDGGGVRVKLWFRVSLKSVCGVQILKNGGWDVQGGEMWVMMYKIWGVEKGRGCG